MSLSLYYIETIKKNGEYLHPFSLFSFLVKFSFVIFEQAIRLDTVSLRAVATSALFAISDKAEIDYQAYQDDNYSKDDTIYPGHTISHPIIPTKVARTQAMPV